MAHRGIADQAGQFGQRQQCVGRGVSGTDDERPLAGEPVPVEPELHFEPEANASYDLAARVLNTIKESGASKFGFLLGEVILALSGGALGGDLRLAVEAVELGLAGAASGDELLSGGDDDGAALGDVAGAEAKLRVSNHPRDLIQPTERLHDRNAAAGR